MPDPLASRQDTPRAGAPKRSLQLCTSPNTQTLLRMRGEISRTDYFTSPASLLPRPASLDHKILRAGLPCRLQLHRFLLPFGEKLCKYCSFWPTRLPSRQSTCLMDSGKGQDALWFFPQLWENRFCAELSTLTPDKSLEFSFLTAVKSSSNPSLEMFITKKHRSGQGKILAENTSQ